VLGQVPESPDAPEISDESILESLSEFEFKNNQVKSLQFPGFQISLKDLITEAYLHRVHLGALGFFKYPGLHFNKVTGQGNPFFYYTQGVAISEIELDRFTSEVKVLESSLLMDLGRPLLESIDRGQCVGAFVQGMGWVTNERLVYDAQGKLLTHAPSTYKIPSVHDIPRKLTVDFFVNDSGSANVRGSKAVGEPPLLLGISVWLAIKNALRVLKRSQDEAQICDLPIPLNQERAALLLI
jgi:xanthine dehydrogenase large subunit